MINRIGPTLAKGCRKLLWVLCTLPLLTLFLPLNSSGSRLAPAEERGRQIYLKTTSPSGGEIKAYLGKESYEAPGSAVSCVNCHGHDGRGLDEAGVTATDITWEELTKVYGVKRVKGRTHPAYTEETVIRAIREGIDSGGNPLDPVMPRYEMSAQDFGDLLSYLKRIATLLDPGVTERVVRVGTVMPTKGGLGVVGDAMRAVISAYFAEINGAGGIFNRKLELRTAEYGDTPEATLDAARQLIGADEVFAVVSPFTSGIDKETAELMESEEVPMIGPFTLYPEDITSLNRFTFYLFSGLREQSRVLVVFAGQKLQGEGRQAGILYSDKEIPTDIVEAVEAQGTKSGWGPFDKIGYDRTGFDASRIAGELSRKGMKTLFFLGAWKELKALIESGAKIGWIPSIYLSGSQVERDVFDLPQCFSNKIFLAYPSLPQDHTEGGLRELGMLAKKYDLSQGNLAAQISAYCSAKIFVEGIKLTGRDLSREKLVKELERLYNFNTGLTQGITYDPNRRIGALGAYVVTVDLEKKTFVPVSKWIALD